MNLLMHGRTLEIDPLEQLIEARHYDRVSCLGIITRTSSGTYHASVLRPVDKVLRGVADDGSWHFSNMLCNSIVESPTDGFRVIEAVIDNMALSSGEQ